MRDPPPERATKTSRSMVTVFTLEPIDIVDFAFRWSVFDATIRPYIETLFEVPADQIEEMVRSNLAGSGNHAAIVVDGERSGVVQIEETGERISLHQIEILPEYQGQGIGTAIVQSLLDRANATGKPVHLSVFHRNTSARNLYARLGFTVTSESERDVQMTYIPARWGSGRVRATTVPGQERNHCGSEDDQPGEAAQPEAGS